ncbi:4-(cytidine 5'-diphospho)-2-C-methyl-D-erythritol kinase [Helicobacter typhlonius]|uniref:4-(cytidine 5'-diphospho)-2-C-methyl-D-erythritol kinase n=1 Tax=Helicobacter typhlonius TaxID=76936 RepID=UPI002FE28467
MICKIYPKLNIFLKVIGYENGFHQLNSRFVRAYGNLYDEMEIRTHSCFVLLGDFGCAVEDNLIFKAKCALQEYLASLGKGADILETIKVEVQKSIPQGAGLGGGSANAGEFLRVINEMGELNLSDKELMGIAQGIGADVSFFASGEESANVSGKGEKIEAFMESSALYEIHTPKLFCDTTKVYQAYADFIHKCKAKYSTPTKEWFKLTSRELLGQSHSREVMNDLFLSAVSVYPVLQEIAQELGSEWYFSGSGSSFFCLKNMQGAGNLQSALDSKVTESSMRFGKIGG